MIKTMQWEIGYRLKKNTADPYNTPYTEIGSLPDERRANWILVQLRTDFPEAEWRMVQHTFYA